MEFITNLFWTFPSLFPRIFLLSFFDNQHLDFFAEGGMDGNLSSPPLYWLKYSCFTVLVSDV